MTVKRGLSDSELIGSIYEAAMQPDGAAWQGVLEAMRQRLNASSAFMFTPYLRPAEGFYTSINIPQEFFDVYATYYFRKDVWTLAAEQKDASRGNYYTDQMLVPECDLIGTEWYCDALEPIGIFRLLGCILADDSLAGLPRVHMSFYRPPGAKPFNDQDVAAYRQLGGHLRRANDIFWRLRGADLRHQADLSVLDRLAVGVVLLNGSGEVLRANQAAQRALSRNDGLGLSQRRLTAGAAPANVKLFRAIGQACACGSGVGASAGGAVAIQRPSGKRPWSLLIAPLPVQAPPWLGTRSPAAIVFITDPEAPHRAGTARVAELHGLTPAEQRLLEHLVQGLSAKEAAERHGVSFHTVRSQMKSLFSKTGVSRYGELVRMAAQAELLAGPEEDTPRGQ